MANQTSATATTNSRFFKTSPAFHAFTICILSGAARYPSRKRSGLVRRTARRLPHIHLRLRLAGMGAWFRFIGEKSIISSSEMGREAGSDPFFFFDNRAKTGTNETTGTAGTDALAAFSKDNSTAAGRIEDLLKIEDPADFQREAQRLTEEFPDLLPDDPAMAAVLADEMARAMADAVKIENGKLRIENCTPANAGTSEGARKGWETRRLKSGWTPEQFKENKSRVDRLISDLNKKGPDGKSKAWQNKVEPLGEVKDAMLNDIKAANPKMDMSGAVTTVETAQLQHALDKHGIGMEKLPNHIPITKDDLGKLTEVLSDYDSITAGKGKAEGKSTEAVEIRKKYPDGTIVCVELDWFRRGNKRHELRFQTMFKEKKNED